MYIPRRRWSQRPPVNVEPIPMTPDGVTRLEARLERLKKSLPAIIEEAARTAAYGDRSDNAEYKEAKGILRRTRGQILRIEDQLKRIVPIEAGEGAGGTVRLGSTVTLESDGKTMTYLILGSAETDPGRGRISHTSPLGAALIGRRKGDEIKVKLPAGNRIYRIEDIR